MFNKKQKRIKELEIQLSESREINKSNQEEIKVLKAKIYQMYTQSLINRVLPDTDNFIR